MSHRMRRCFVLITISAGSWPVPSAVLAPIRGLAIPLGLPGRPTALAGRFRLTRSTLPTRTRTARCSTPGSSTSSTKRLCVRLDAFWQATPQSPADAEENGRSHPSWWSPSSSGPNRHWNRAAPSSSITRSAPESRRPSQPVVRAGIAVVLRSIGKAEATSDE